MYVVTAPEPRPRLWSINQGAAPASNVRGRDASYSNLDPKGGARIRVVAGNGNGAEEAKTDKRRDDAYQFAREEDGIKKNHPWCHGA